MKTIVKSTLIACAVVFLYQSFGADARHASAQDVDAQNGVADEISSEELDLVRKVETARIKVIEQVVGSVIAIYGKDRQGGGSGVIIDPSGIALTNHHVIEGAGLKGLGGLNDGELYKWDLIGTDPGGDVAIIKMKGKDPFPYSPLGDSDKVKVGDWAIAMGNPFLLAHDQVPTVTLGIISGVERFQGGSSNNKLVYGNCIQIDSSINPGNSGGPLFNMSGEVIGINGRGSFRDRGRVNVGLGYAISSNQIKNFVPDLMATKIVEHGTLDANFSDRDGSVVCSTINLDAPVAQAGLELGDRLVEFERRPISYANQFKNIICTLPEAWPAELVIEKKDGRRLTINVRMFGLPYNFAASMPPDPGQPPKGQPPKGQPPKGKQPGKQPDPEKQEQKDSKGKPDDAEGKDKDKDQPPRGQGEQEKKKPAKGDDSQDKDAGDKDDQDKTPKPGGRPPRTPRRRGNPELRAYLIQEAGVVLDTKTNKQNLDLIFDSWRKFARGSVSFETPKLIRMNDEIWNGDKKVGSQSMWLASDGRFRIEHELDSGKSIYTWDGTDFFEQRQESRKLSLIQAKTNPVISQAISLLGPIVEKPLEQFGTPTLDGGDKAQRQIVYRIMFLDDDEDWFYCWLSVFDEDGRPQVKLMKCSSDKNCATKARGMSMSNWQDVDGIKMPFTKQLIAGLDESVVWTAKTIDCQVTDEIDAALFQVPTTGTGDSN